MQKANVDRYIRQTILEEIGDVGQKILKNSSALIVGCGALGSTIASHLARAGLGIIKVLDRDTVEIENLHRQILYDEKDIGTPKAIAAQKKLRDINSEIDVEAFVKDLNPYTVEKIVKDVSIVMDGTDNMGTRYLINDICVKKKIPWVYGGAVSTYGMSMNIIPNETACLVCAFPFMPKAGSLPTCDTVGVLNTVPGIIGSIQTTEAIKILLNKKFSRDLIVYDVWDHDFQRIKLNRNLDCNCCVASNFEYLNAKKVEITSILCGSNSVQVTPAIEGEISLVDMSERLRNVGEVKLSPMHLIFKTKEATIHIFKDGRAIIKGTNDETLAKLIYAKYVGS